MKPATHYLGEAAPGWFTIDALDKYALIGRACVPKTPWAVDGLHLRIFGDRTPRVGEATPGADLPARCPERHIQGDQTFCLGLRYIDVRSVDDAARWWEQLWQYLVCQGVAERTRIWPPGQALDHGDAGRHHERALALAAEAGLEEEYAAARLGEPSWLTDARLHLFGKKGRLINGRAFCPRGCLRSARGREVRMLRRDCPKRGLLVELAYTEQLRRQALADYWKGVFNAGMRCCRSMRSCPLGEHEDRSQANPAEGEEL